MRARPSLRAPRARAPRLGAVCGSPSPRRAHGVSAPAKPIPPRAPHGFPSSLAGAGVAAATAELQRSNEALHERNATLTTYVDNLMYTVAAKDLALAPPATRSKGLHPLRRLAMLASVPERAPPEGGPPPGRAR